MDLNWAITFLAIHLVFAAACFWLYKAAPCWMQKLSVFGLGAALATMSLGYFILVVSTAFPSTEWWGSWHVIMLGLVIEHIAVLLYVFRLTYQRMTPWPTSSQAFPNLPG